MISHYGNTLNRKHINVQLASLACGVALAAVAIVGGSEILRDTNDSTVSPPTHVVSQPTSRFFDPSDFGSQGIDYQLAQQEARTASASSLRDARGIGEPGEGTYSVEATLIDPTDFGSLGIESVLARSVYPPEAAVDYSLPTTFAADFFGAGQPVEAFETLDASLFGSMVDGVYVMEDEIQLH